MVTLIFSFVKTEGNKAFMWIFQSSWRPYIKDLENASEYFLQYPFLKKDKTSIISWPFQTLQRTFAEMCFLRRVGQLHNF